MWLPCHWIDKDPTDHCSIRPASAEIDAIILHYTAGGFYKGSANWFKDSRTSASAHFIVGRKGEIVQMVATDNKAHHAGDGGMLYRGEQTDPNDFSIGIEIANFGLLEYSGSNFFYRYGNTRFMYDCEKFGFPQRAKLQYYCNGPRIEGYWERYKVGQIAAVVKLCKFLMDVYKIPTDRIVGHSDTALPLGRKKDPGPLFPWRTFIETLGGNFDLDNINKRSESCPLNGKR